MTFNGNNVSQVLDKSGFGNTLSQSTPSFQPTFSFDSTYGRNGLYFNRANGNCLIGNTGTFMVNGTIWNSFMVFRFDGTGGTNVQTITRSPVTGRWVRYAGGNMSFFVLNGEVQFTRTNPFGGVYSQIVAANSINVFENGTSVGSGGRAAAPLVQEYYNFGGTAANSECMGGFIFEYIIYSGVTLTTIQQQQVEGYLAWKWGLQANLPNSHLYRNFPPTSLSVQIASELNLVNSAVQSGIISLPAVSSIPGRILTFKDRLGTFEFSTATLSTSGIDRFEDSLSSFRMNNAFGAYSFIGGTDNKWYSIGGSYMNTAAISSIVAIASVMGTVSSANATVSTLQFRDGVTQSTNTVFGLSTNLYYSTPINFFVVGPAKAPKPLLLSIRPPFVPSQISGLQLWFDGADQNTLQQTGVAVTRWLDKSGNNRFATGINSPRTGSWIVNGLPCISLNTNQFFAGSYAGFLTTTTMTSFVVAFTTVSLPRVGGDQRLLSIATNNTTQDFTNAASAIVFFNQGGTSAISTYRNGGYIGSNAIVTNTPFLACSLYNGTNGFLFFNGSAATLTGIASSGSFNAGAFGIGNAANITSEFWNGSIGEILLYSSSFTQAERERVEGYLAWKWGLVGNLPSSHPFKNSPP
jgi:hypothetical protein